MMRRAISATLACAAVLAVGVQTAAADVANLGVARCDTDATWTLSYDTSGNAFVQWSYDTGSATNTGCKHLSAVVYDDLDFKAEQRDFAQVDGGLFRLFGVRVTGSDDFVGTANGVDGAGATGPLTITGDLLNATIVVVSPNGHRAVIENRGTGRCGTRCYKTRSTWVATNV